MKQRSLILCARIRTSASDGQAAVVEWWWGNTLPRFEGELVKMRAAVYSTCYEI
jgi:hypothetical protein